MAITVAAWQLTAPATGSGPGDEDSAGLSGDSSLTGSVDQGVLSPGAQLQHLLRRLGARPSTDSAGVWRLDAAAIAGSLRFDDQTLINADLELPAAALLAESDGVGSEQTEQRLLEAIALARGYTAEQARRSVKQLLGALHRHDYHGLPISGRGLRFGVEDGIVRVWVQAPPGAGLSDDTLY